MSSKKRSPTNVLEDLSEGRTNHRLEESDSDETNLPYYPADCPGQPTQPVAFQQPSSLLTFSYTPARELEFTDSAMRYYVEPPKGADLRYGYDRWIRQRAEKGRIDSLLRAVSKVRTRMDSNTTSGSDWLRDIGIVAWRGVMTKLLIAPYEERDQWQLNVMYKNGTMYFEEHISDARLAENENMAPNHRLQTYYGYSFESYCTSSLPNGREPHKVDKKHVYGWGGDVDTNVQWCSVVKTKLADTRLVIGGEVDCVRGRFTGKPDSFVELKTSLTIRSPRDEARFEKKLLKFYFQSFLLGVPEIVVGFRTPSGQITTLQSFKTVQIPRMVRGKPGAWDPQICLDWGRRFIAYLKSHVTSSEDISDERGASDVKVWRVKFVPRVGVSIMRLDSEGVDEVENGEDRVGFLPKWFVDELETKRAGRETSAPVLSTTVSKSVTDPPIPAGWQI